MSWLKNHPFAVEAFFERSLVLTFAAPQEALAPLLPTGLSLDTYEDQWAFLAIAMVQTKALRPKGFPLWLGQDFFLAGYRIFVRYRNQAGRNLRGLYILKSETDSWQMSVLGNLFTHYRYTQTDIQQAFQDEVELITSQRSGFQLRIAPAGDSLPLPPNSPFPNWKVARRYAGPLPHTFTKLDAQSMLIIRGIRQDWMPRPVAILDYHFDFLENLELPGIALASAF
jgi:hypothetical protein